MANVVRAALTRAVKAADFGKGLGFRSAQTLGGETDGYEEKADIAASELETGAAGSVSIADAGGFTSTATVEAALQEIYGRLPNTIDQALDLVIDTTVGTGTDLRATSLVLPVLASSLYKVEATLFLSGTANSGYKFGFTGPTDATMVWQSLIFDAADSVIVSGENAITDAEGATAALTFVQVNISGILTVSTTAGDLTVVAAQNVDHADDTTVHAESTLTVTKV